MVIVLLQVIIYGLNKWADLFTPRQGLMLITLTRLVREIGKKIAIENESGFVKAVQSFLACGVDREAEHSSSLCRWNSSGQKMQATFGRQALPMLWDSCETNPFGGSVGSWESIITVILIPFQTALSLQRAGQIERSSAITHPLPNDLAQAFITDPPYYDSVPYADLADFFYV